MSTFEEVDRYLVDLFDANDEVLEAALQRARAADLPDIAVSPMLGALLHVLALSRQARRILEIGTLGGYSTIWLARALPRGGRLISLEYEPRHAEVARANLEHAGLADRTEVRVGRAVDTLADLEAAGEGPFDLVFMDADKPSYPDYLAASLRLSVPGTVIVADNVVGRGSVADPDARDEAAIGARRFNEALAADDRVAATVIQTVGVKGHDGMALAVVT